MKNTLIYYLLLITLFLACKVEKINPETVNLGYEYYPLKIGQKSVYKVHEQIFGILKNIDTTYYIKEEIVDTITDGEELSYHIHRFYKAKLSDEWKFDSIWSAKRTEKFAIRVENNKRLLKLVFPLEKGQKWDENLLNTSEKNEATLSMLNQKIIIADTLVYENALKIDYPSEETQISSKQHIEVYQKNIGLSYFYEKNLSFQADQPQTGKIVEKILIENE